MDKKLLGALESALERIEEGVFIVDKRGILVYCNSMAARICTVEGRCRNGEPFFAQCKRDIGDRLHSLMHDLMANPDQTPTVEGVVDGIDFEASAYALLESIESAEVFAYMVGVIRDVTRRKRLSRIARQIASVDSLTRLYNRRHFYMKLKEEAKRAKRLGYPLSVAVLDVDDFKDVNERLGHLGGDAALRAVAEAICRNVRRDVDVACRYGGDEFALIISGADAEKAAEVARRIRDDVSKIQHPRLTISGGVAELGERDPEELVNIADRAMFRAKSLGGDLVFVEHGT